MTDAIFTIDDDNAVIRIYPSNVPGLSGNARRAVITALLPSWQALAECLRRLTGAVWTVVDAEAQDEEGTAMECGRLVVNGHYLGTAERDSASGLIEAGPHVTDRATMTVGVTGATITDGQIRELLGSLHDDTARQALGAHGHLTRDAARRACADAFNARAWRRS